MPSIKEIVTLILIGGVIFLSGRWTAPESTPTTDVDTVYVDVPYSLDIDSGGEDPEQVINYAKDTTKTVQNINFTKKNVEIVLENNNVINYSPTFLTNYIESPKFLGLTADDRLRFTGMRPNGQTQTSIFEKYDYYSLKLDGSGWISYHKEKPPFRKRFKHSAEAGYKLNHDFTTGPYLEYSPHFELFGVDLIGTAHLSKYSHIKIGIKIDL